MRLDRPGYQYRTNHDGSRAHYWNPKRASKQYGAKFKVVRLPDDATDDEIASRCQELTDQLLDGRVADIKKAQMRSATARHLAMLYKKRAREKGLEYGLSAELLEVKLVDLADSCEISGIDFNYEPQPRGIKSHFKHPLRPSVDRINNRLGYIEGNIRMVLHCVNIALNEWGLDNYIAVCAAVTSHMRRDYPDISGLNGRLYRTPDDYRSKVALGSPAFAPSEAQ